MAYEAFNDYLNDKCERTKNILYDILESSIVRNDPAAVNLNILLTDDSAMSPNFIHEDFVGEMEAEELENRLQEQRDKKKADEIFGKVKRYLDEQFENSESAKLQEKTNYCLNAIANNQGLNLEKHIADIKNSPAASNQRLMEVLDQYATAIRQGAYEERLYETFIHNIGKYNYLLSVDKAIKKLNETVNNNKEQISLTKLLEEMKDDHSSFIYVELIQEDVARYVKEPNTINRVQLRNALMPYASDPYINEMFNIIYSDNSKRGNELEETAMNIKDQIKLIREDATVSNIYTPVQYVKENECVFNVNGQFYVKKGNNIIVLDEDSVDNLDERFVELCQLVNNPYVTINDDNTITLASNSKMATIYEGCVDIFGHKETKESLRNLREMCIKYDDYDTNFYIMCSCLLENFNNIAKIDWAKHISLNVNENINADIFKLDNNIFLSTHDDSLNQHTFYRNINPIFCKNKLNEHMGINVSSMFTDLLPNQDKIILKLNETKNQYEESISQYEDMIQKLKDSLEDASDENKKELEDALNDATTKLDDIKDEYKEWQKQADEATGKESDDDDEGNDDVKTEEPNTPIEDDEVEAATPELSQPLTDGNPEDYNEEDDSWIENGEEAETGEGEFDETPVSDDEFTDMMGDEDDDEYPFAEDDDEDEGDEDEDDEDGDEDDEDDENGEGEYNENPEDDTYAGTEQPDKEEFEPISFNDETPEQEPIISDDSLTNDEVFGDDEQETPSIVGEEPSVPEIPEEPTEDAEISDETPNAPIAYQEDFAYKIANVMFNENLKDGTKEKSGSVIVIVPMVDGTGRKYVENKTVEFYLSDNNTPILDNEPMTNELYQAVVDAIVSHPDYKIISETGEPASEGQSTIASLHQIKSDELEDADWEKEYMRDGNSEDIGYYGPNMPDESDDSDLPTEDDVPTTLAPEEMAGAELPEETPDASTEPTPVTEPESNDEDEYPNWGFEDYTEPWSDKPEDDTFGFTEADFADEDTPKTDDKDEDEDDEESDDVIIPSYKDGDTEIEFPASNVDKTIIPESKQPITEKKKISIKPIYKNKNGKRFF